MKRLFLICLVFFLLACSDDSPSIPSSDFLSYDNQIYTISDGLYVDFGTDSSEYLSHYNYDLFLTDGIAFTDESGRAFANSNFIFYVELFSTGSDQFDGGVFSYLDSQSATIENVAGQNWFSLVLLSTDAGYDPLVEGIGSGTIDVDQDGDTFDLTISLQLEDGTTLSAKYDGTLRRSIYLVKTD